MTPSLADACIVIPTFNERDNVARLAGALRALSREARIIIVDDGSPDGTGAAADELAAKDPRLTVIHRQGKGGRGSAVSAGFKAGLADPAVKWFVEMDADFSHDPAELRESVETLARADMVLRSRYLPQSRIENWPIPRRIFSKLSNIFARVLLGMPLTDYTNGYRAYSRKAVEAIEFDKIVSSGYIVLSAVALQLFRKGFRVAELPSVFVNRKRGESNLSRREIAGALIGVLRLGFSGSAPVVVAKATAAGLAVTALPLAAFYWRTGYFSGYVKDLAILATRCHRPAAGQLIYRDFDCITTPMTYLIQAGLYAVFGQHWDVTRAYVAVQGCLAGALTFAVARLLLGLGGAASLACAAIGLLWSPQMIGGLPWYDSEAGFFGAAALASILWSWDRRWLGGPFLFGLLCSCVFWSKQDVGGAALVLGLACAAARAWGRGPKEIARETAAWGAGAAVPFLGFAAYFASQGILDDAWHWLVPRAVAFGWERSGHGLGAKIWLTLFGGRSQIGKLLVLFYGFVVAFSWWASRRQPERAALLRRNAWAALFAGGMSYAGFLTHDGAHFEFLQSQLGCLAAILMHSAGSSGPLAIALASLLAARGLKYTQQNAFSAPVYGTLNAAVFGSLKVPKPLADASNDAERFVRERLNGETFAVLPPDIYPELHMAVGQAPPQPVTATSEMLSQDPPRIIEALEKNRVNWVFAAPEELDSVGAAADYLRKNFREEATLAGGRVVLKRR